MCWASPAGRTNTSVCRTAAWSAGCGCGSATNGSRKWMSADQSEQPDEGDRRKAAFSDALKRAAVKFGIGRYLYRLPSQWVDYDPKKRQFARTPKLPPSALPRPHVSPASVSADAAAPRSKPSALPADGTELRQRLQHYEEQLVKNEQCRPGELLRFVTEAGEAAGFASDLTTWEGPAIQLAVEQTKAFKERLPLRMEGRKEVGRSMPRLVTAGMVEAGKGIGG